MDSDIAAAIAIGVVTVLPHASTAYGQKKRAKQPTEYVDETCKCSSNALLLKNPIGPSVSVVVSMLSSLVTLARRCGLEVDFSRG